MSESLQLAETTFKRSDPESEGECIDDQQASSFRTFWRGCRNKVKCPECNHISRFRKCCLCAEPLLNTRVVVCSDCIGQGRLKQRLRHCLSCGVMIESVLSTPARSKCNTSQMQGWLDVYTEQDHKYHRRYYIVQDNFLYGFKSTRLRRTDTLNFLEGFRFNPVDHGPGRRFGIEMGATAASPYQVFYAESDAVRNLWLYAFRKAAKQLIFEDYYVLGEKIGAGHFAQVYKCWQKSTGALFAVKIMNLQECKDVVRAEASLLPLIHHPNIAFFKDVFKTDRQIYFVMSYEAGGDLCARIHDKGPFPEATAKIFMKKLISAVTYLHHLGIAHRDLKPENIMMSSPDSDTEFKVIDFGLCDFSTPGDISRQPCGTFAYMAPEIATQYDYRIDIWNVGVIMYYILTGRRPFRSYDLKKLLEQRKLDWALQEIASRKLQIPEDDESWAKISSDAKSLLHALMHHDVEKRITLKQALEHPWFNEEGQ